jgi:hypothetical protein
MEDQGVLSFEWILLITVLVIGIVGGLSAVRDGLLDEPGDVTGAVVDIDPSWLIEPDPRDRCLLELGNCADPHADTADDGSDICRRRPESP